MVQINRNKTNETDDISNEPASVLGFGIACREWEHWDRTPHNLPGQGHARSGAVEAEVASGSGERGALRGHDDVARGHELVAIQSTF